MGQRLVVQLEADGEPLANAYYHWSAYTGSSLEKTNDIIKFFHDAPNHLPPNHCTDKLKAIWALFQTGARINDTELSNIANNDVNKKLFGFVFDGAEVDRNRGLLCITQEGMDDSMGWAEHTVVIDVATGDIDFEVLYESDVEDWKRDQLEYDNPVLVEDLPVLDIRYRLTMDETWDRFYESIIEILGMRKYSAISPDGERVYDFIE